MSTTTRMLAGLRSLALTAVLAVPAITSAIAADKVVIYTNWFAEAEHGGIWQAKAAGIFEKYGIDAEVRQGGPQVNTSLILLGGKADFVMLHNSGEMFSAVKERAPLVAVASYYQRDPQAILTHRGQNRDSLGSLKEAPIILSQDALNSWWPWLKSKYGYTDDQIRPYNFQMGAFLSNKKSAQQGYITTEPSMVRKEGVDPNVFLLDDYGWNPYSALLVTRQETIDQKSDLVKRVTQATLEGWYSYYQNGTSGNALIKQTAPNNTDEVITNALDEMKKNGIVLSGEALTLGIGAMTDARWNDFFNTAVSAGLYEKGLTYKQAYTLKFVNDQAFFKSMQAKYPNAVKNASAN
jgi:NitT/TauT family transport system substrate-binding protein